YATSKEVAVGFIFAGESTSGLGVLRADALAVDVDAENIVAKLGEHFGAPLLVSGEAHPLVDEQDARALALDDGLVIGQITIKLGVAIAILDGLHVDLGARGRDKAQGEKCGEENLHGMDDIPMPAINPVHRRRCKTCFPVGRIRGFMSASCRETVQS